MMKQQIWIVNSSLVLFLLLLLGVQTYIKRELPSPKRRKSHAPQTQLAHHTIAINLEKIYKNDLFDTYISSAEKKAEKKNLVTPIPQLTLKEPPAPPEVKKQEILPPLTISIKGIILSDDPDESIALIADQTNKENTYYVGSKLQDGQVIKMTKNKVIILRASGQQETHYLRKPEKLTATLENWDFAIKKIDEKMFHIDPTEFVKEVTSVGELVEALELGTVYQKGKAIGMRVGDVQDNPVGAHLGLKEADMITSINGIDTLTPENRKKIHANVLGLKLGDQIIVDIDQNGTKKTITYLLKKLQKPSPFDAPTDKNKKGEKEDAKENELFKLGPNAKRRQRRRSFEHRHRTAEQQGAALGEMRSRLLANMRGRAHNRRVW